MGWLWKTMMVIGVIGLPGPKLAASDISIPVPPSLEPIVESGPSITNPSGAAEIELAKHLTQVGATMYGAYWCDHCHAQKQLFGQEAFQEINYIECASDGKNAQPERCKADKIEYYPTWKINDQALVGTQPLEKLGQVSNYQGPQDFQNSQPQKL